MGTRALKQELIDERAAGEAIVVAAQNDGNRDLTAGKLRKLGDHAKTVEALSAKIEAAEQTERHMEMFGPPDGSWKSEVASANPAHLVRPEPPLDPTISCGVNLQGKRFADLFPQAAHDSGGFKDWEDFVGALRRGEADGRLRAATTKEVGDASGSGYNVPPMFVRGLSDEALEREVVRPRARSIGMNSNIMQAPIWDAFDRSSGKIAGFSASWVGEDVQSTPQAPDFKGLQMRAFKLLILGAASNEMIADAPSFTTELRRNMVESISDEMDDAFINGTGAGMPLGVLNDEALIVVAKESAQTADSIVYANLRKMLGRLHPSGYSRAVWVVNGDLIPELLNLFVSDGTVGSWLPVMRETPAGGFRILGLPVIVSDKMQALGDQGDILLADFSRYVVGLRSAVTMQASEHIAFDYDSTWFRTTMRAAGQGSWTEAVTPRSGVTQSWCVTLAERA
jgi:HK97 family phage major capsid protein